MADPLALLGESISNFGQNFAARSFQNAREDKLRQQQLDDQARARQMQLDDRTHSETRADTLLAAQQTRENELYNQRKYDAIKVQLVKDRLLDPSDESLEGFVAALKSRGPDYERNLNELGQLKAHAIALIEQSKGDATELNTIFTLGPDQIDTARKLMSTAAAALSIKLQSDEDLKLKSREAGGVALAAANSAISVANQRIEQLNEESDRLMSGALRPDEVAEVRKQAMSLPDLAGLKETDLMKPSNQALVQAAMAKAEQNFRMMRSFQVKEALKTATNQQRNAAVQMEAITQAARSGLPIDFKAVTGDAAAPAAKQGGATAATGTTKAAGSADVAAFLGGEKPAAKTETKGTAKSTPAATPASLSDEYGGLIGALNAVKKVPLPTADRVGEAARNIAMLPATAANYVVGGTRRMNEGIAERASILSGDRAIETNAAKTTADQLAEIDRELQWLLPSAGQADAGKRINYLRRLRETIATPPAL